MDWLKSALIYKKHLGLVCICGVMKYAIISLGSNLGDKLSQLIEAKDRLSDKGYEILACSGVYETEPVGFESEHVFYNAALLVSTNKLPMELLNDLMQIEQVMGRIRNAKGYSDRTIDLDLLIYEGVQMESEYLTLPHPRLRARLFVLLPLQDLALKFPGLDMLWSVSEWINVHDGALFPHLLPVQICIKKT